MKQGIGRREREVTDIDEIIGILDRAKIVHVGMIDGDSPYVVPMNYGYTMENGKLTLYLHCAKQGRKLDILRVNPKVFIELDTDIVPFEGMIACNFGICYSSVMGKGIAEIIEDAEGKKEALTILMKTQTQKDFIFDDRMVSVVTVIKIHLDEFTAKRRPMPTHIVK